MRGGFSPYEIYVLESSHLSPIEYNILYQVHHSENANLTSLILISRMAHSKL